LALTISIQPGSSQPLTDLYRAIADLLEKISASCFFGQKSTRQRA